MKNLQVIIYKRKMLGLEFFHDTVGNGIIERWGIRTKYGSIRIHYIKKSDSERDLHDHTFWFYSFILYGGYLEYLSDNICLKIKPFSLIFRKATDKHRLVLIKNKAITICLTGPQERKWGFYTKNGWIEASKY